MILIKYHYYTMHELTESELYPALKYAKSINEETGRKIIERFHLDQPILAQAIFGMFPAALAEASEEMSYLFMDLCFDVLCIFQKSFGSMLSQKEMDSDWFEKQAVLLDTELQSIISDRNMDDKIRKKLQDRFLNRIIQDSPQMELVNLMHEAIDDYASENSIDLTATRTTQTMIFIVIRLFSNLYSYTSGKKH